MLLVALLLLGASGDEHAIAPGQIEGRPPAAETSPLQARVDAARPGDTLVVAARRVSRATS